MHTDIVIVHAVCTLVCTLMHTRVETKGGHYISCSTTPYCTFWTQSLSLNLELGSLAAPVILLSLPSTVWGLQACTRPCLAFYMDFMEIWIQVLGFLQQAVLPSGPSPSPAITFLKTDMVVWGDTHPRYMQVLAGSASAEAVTALGSLPGAKLWSQRSPASSKYPHLSALAFWVWLTVLFLGPQFLSNFFLNIYLHCWGWIPIIDTIC